MLYMYEKNKKIELFFLIYVKAQCRFCYLHALFYFSFFLIVTILFHFVNKKKGL